MTTQIHDEAAPLPTFAEALPVWLKIGLLSFGGPAGQIAMMHRMLVDERRWIDEDTYLSALNFCMLLPGPEAMQLATYAGWRLHGLKGGLAAGLLFVAPGAAVMLALSALYAVFGQLPFTQALFFGIKAAVLAIVVEALLRVSRRALKTRLSWIIAACAFLAIFAFAVPFPVIVLTAALVGFAHGVWGAGANTRSAAIRLPAGMLATTARTLAIWLVIWIVPLVAIAKAMPGVPVIGALGWFFSKMAVVTFGGAYAVLAYMGQDVVAKYGWLTTGQMMDGLGLAETTPGPLILVTEYVGFLAAYNQAAHGPALALGFVGAFVALWATFAPCFLWIFAGAPYVEWLNAQPRLKSALGAVTAAVVGVILNLTVWFGLHVLFARVDAMAWGPLQTHVPQWASLSWPALALTALAFIVLFALHRGIVTALLACGGAALLLARFGLLSA